MQPYLYRRPDSESRQSRRAVPKHLQAEIGKRDITQSLRTDLLSFLGALDSRNNDC
jgi:hypothetical protein